MTNVIHHPRGGMCANCAHKNDNCSGKQFNKMHVIDEYKENDILYKIVACRDRSK